MSHEGTHSPLHHGESQEHSFVDCQASQSRECPICNIHSKDHDINRLMYLDDINILKTLTKMI